VLLHSTAFSSQPGCSQVSVGAGSIIPPNLITGLFVSFKPCPITQLYGSMENISSAIRVKIC
jgi:hypothetical protein